VEEPVEPLPRCDKPASRMSSSAVTPWLPGWRARTRKPSGTPRASISSRRDDFPHVVDMLQSIGFIHRNISGIDLFLDGPEGSMRSAIHIVFAGGRVRPDHPLPSPDVAEAEAGPDFPVPTLEALVRMKLTSFRLKDKVHLVDLLEVGLIDETWRDRLPPEIAGRLEELIDERHREGSLGDGLTRRVGPEAGEGMPHSAPDADRLGPGRTASGWTARPTPVGQLGPGRSDRPGGRRTGRGRAGRAQGGREDRNLPALGL
jgi:hypothetical protein